MQLVHSEFSELAEPKNQKENQQKQQKHTTNNIKQKQRLVKRVKSGVEFEIAYASQTHVWPAVQTNQKEPNTSGFCCRFRTPF